MCVLERGKEKERERLRDKRKDSSYSSGHWRTPKKLGKREFSAVIQRSKAATLPNS